jgi:hypothetical protein
MAKDAAKGDKDARKANKRGAARLAAVRIESRGGPADGDLEGTA